MRTLKPLFDRIVVKPTAKAEKTASGIFIPETAKGTSQDGIVVASGPGRTLADGTFVPNTVKEGDFILYSKYSGSQVKVEDDELLIINERDVLAIVK